MCCYAGSTFALPTSLVDIAKRVCDRKEVENQDDSNDGEMEDNDDVTDCLNRVPDMPCSAECLNEARKIC
jgi:hypothetical protein